MILARRDRRNKVVSVLLVLALMVCLPLEAHATATQKKENAQSALNETNEKIESLKSMEQEVNAQLSAKGQELSDILVNQSMIQIDIQNTEDAMVQAENDLVEAQAVADKQYADMKLRIQFMYENSSRNSFWTAILEAHGIADMLNRIEYVQKVEETDRSMLEAYEATVQEIKDIQVALKEQHDQLTELKATYDAQQAQVEAIIAELRSSAADFQQQIESARALAESYKETIAEANAQIERERQEQKRREEEERARREKEQQEANNPGGNTGGDGGNSGGNGGGDTGGYPGGSGVNPGGVTGVSGQEVVNFALQYVGKPYVWGGNDLNTGVDCSGFVHAVYAHFGISTVRYSMAFASEGQAVSSDCMQPGDVIVYAPKYGIGHVAIYVGNGCIVEAQSSAAGITSNRAWNCREIVAIRRLV